VSKKGRLPSLKPAEVITVRGIISQAGWTVEEFLAKL